MRQAIVTKYLGATNHRSARVKATASAGSIVIPWDCALDVTANHTAAARAFALKYGWAGSWVGGGAPDGTGNVYVNAAPTASHGIGRALSHAGPVADDLDGGTFTIATADPR